MYEGIDLATLPPIKCPKHNHYMVLAGLMRKNDKLYAVYQCPKKKKLRRYVLIKKMYKV